MGDKKRTLFKIFVGPPKDVELDVNNFLLTIPKKDVVRLGPVLRLNDDTVFMGAWYKGA